MIGHTYQRKLHTLHNRHGVVLTHPQLIAQDVVEKIAYTMTKETAMVTTAMHTWNIA